MDYDLIVVKTLERVYKNYYYIIRGRNYRMKKKIIIYVIVQFLLILCSIFVIPNVEGVLSIFTVLIVIVGNVLNLIFLLKAKNRKESF